jgi:4'-phosphopantetheinyl transferase
VWFLRSADAEPELTAAQLDVLAPEERERASRFRFDKDRRLYLASRVLLRNLLSRHSTVAPRAWAFVADEYGKPRIVSPSGVELDVSVSHTNGLVCCAVAQRSAIGVDAEDITRTVDMSAIVERCFSPGERRRLGRLQPMDARVEFFKHWTLKEALAKALGIGLSADFAALSFRLRGETAAVSFGRSVEGTRRAWGFHLFQPTVDHIIAVCVRRTVPPGERGGVKIEVAQAFFTPHSRFEQTHATVQTDRPGCSHVDLR